MSEFLRSDNPWAWVAGAGIVYLVLKIMKKKPPKVKNPSRTWHLRELNRLSSVLPNIPFSEPGHRQFHLGEMSAQRFSAQEAGATQSEIGAVSPWGKHVANPSRTYEELKDLASSLGYRLKRYPSGKGSFLKYYLSRGKTGRGISTLKEVEWRLQGVQSIKKIHSNPGIRSKVLAGYNPGPCPIANPFPGLFLEERNPDQLLSPGNPKIGALWNFSLPASQTTVDGKPFITCPGQSSWCRKLCYAQKGRFEFGNVKKKYHWNLIQAESPNFVAMMLKEMKGKKNKLMRIHVAGDFYSSDYILKWIQIIKASPDWIFYGYTRCWRVPKLMPLLLKLKALPNMYLMASTDPATGAPPSGWREGAIEKAYTQGALPCRSQTEGILCTTCRRCFMGNNKGVYFKIH